MASGTLTDRLRETLALFHRGGEPLTTAEVTNSLDVGRRSTYERLETLVEQGRLETKKVGANARVWWRPSTDSGEDTPEWPAAAESLVDDVLDDVAMGVFVLDEDLGVAWMNGATERYFGLDRREVLGRDKRTVVDERIGPMIEDSDAFVERVLATYDDNTDTERFECHVTAGEGREQRWLEHRSKPIEAGAYAGGRVELYYDVTDRKHAEQARHDERREFESLVNAVEEYAIFTLDPDGHVRTWNPGAERIKGYEADDILGEHFSQFYTEADRTAGVPQQNLAAAAANGSTVDEGWRVRRDGSRFWANVTITAIRDDDGDLRGYAKVTRDMTDRKRREAERELQYETTRDIAEAETFEEGLRAALRDVCELTDWEYAEVWLPTDDGELRRTDIDYYEDEFAEFSAFSAGHTFGRGEGLPGRVWASGEFEWASDLPSGSFEAYPRRERAVDADLNSSLGVPVVADGDVVAVLTFLMSEVRDTDERLVETVSSVAAELGSLVVRRQAEHERKQEQDLVDQIFAVSPIGILVSNKDGEITRMNDRAGEILDVPDDRTGSYSPTERTMYSADGDRLPPEEHPFARALATGEAVFDSQVRVELPDGGHRWLLINAAPILDADGEVERVVTTGEDITQLKDQTRRLERQREELETELDEVFERISDGFYALDTAFRITYINDHAETLLGLEGSSVVGQDIRETIALSDRFEAALHRALEEQTSVKTEGYDGSLDGWLESTIYPSESGASVHFRDVTERKERERTLEQYESVAETASDSILGIDDQSRIRSVNPAVEEMFGYPPDELLGESLTKLMPERLADAHDTGIAQYLRTGERTLNWDHVEFPGVTADGTEIPLSISFSEYEHDGRHHFTGIVRDITEREERERDLQDRIRQQKVVTDLGTRALEGSSLDALMAEATRLVAETLDNDYCKVLDLDTDTADLSLRQGVGWDDGVVNEATVSAVEDDSQAAYTLATEQPVIVEDLSTEARFSGPDLLRSHDVRSGISTIIGPVDDPWGILGTHDTEVKDFSEHDAAFVQSVANVLAAAIERHDREQEVRHQRDQLAALNSLNQVVQEITNAVIEQSTREEIEAIACERLAASDSYLFAWIGSVGANSHVVRQRAEAGVEGYLDDVVITVDPDDEHSQGPTGRAFRTGEIQVANDVQADSQFEPWRDHAERHGFRSSAAIPIAHEGTVYGVLNVYAERPNAFTGQERAMIGQVGEIVGHAIAAAERKRALLSDELVELAFQVPTVFTDHDMPVEMTGTVTLDHAVAVGDGEYLIYGTATPDALDTLTGLVEVRPHWESVTVRSDGDPSRFELRLTDSPILSAVASHGGYLDRGVIEDGNLRMTIHLAPTVDVRQVIDAVEAACPSAEMVRRKQISRDRDELHHFQRRLMRELTDRQRATLEAAYHAGFFEWPRDASGEEVADSMGVAPPTFHQHLRKAERKVFDAIFSSPIERAGERTD